MTRDKLPHGPCQGQIGPIVPPQESVVNSPKVLVARRHRGDNGGHWAWATAGPGADGDLEIQCSIVGEDPL